MPSPSLNRPLAIGILPAILVLCALLPTARAHAQSGPPIEEGALQILTVNGATVDGGASPGAATDDDDGGADGIVGNEVGHGDELVVRAGGYAPGAEVEIWLFSDPILLAVVSADAQGFIDAVVAIPEAAEMGAHTLRASGTTPTGEVLTVSHAIEIPDVASHTPTASAAIAALDGQEGDAGRGPIVALLGALCGIGLIVLLTRMPLVDTGR